MAEVEKQAYLDCGAVRLSRDGAAEMDGPRPIVWIPRQQTVRLELAYGSAAERTLIALVVGLLLIPVSLLGS
jgi:hypothetical protein